MSTTHYIIGAIIGAFIIYIIISFIRLKINYYKLYQAYNNAINNISKMLNEEDANPNFNMRVINNLLSKNKNLSNIFITGYGPGGICAIEYDKRALIIYYVEAPDSIGSRRPVIKIEKLDV